MAKLTLFCICTGAKFELLGPGSVILADDYYCSKLNTPGYGLCPVGFEKIGHTLTDNEHLLYYRPNPMAPKKLKLTSSQVARFIRGFGPGKQTLTWSKGAPVVVHISNIVGAVHILENADKRIEKQIILKLNRLVGDKVGPSTH